MSRVTLDTAGGAATLRIEGALTIAAATDTRRQLLAALETLLDRPGTPVRLDLSSLDEVDGAGAQLLLALNAALNGAGHRPVVGDCAPGVLAVATALGAAGENQLFGAQRCAQLAEAA